MKTLKVNLFCSENVAHFSGRSIPEPNSRMKKNAAKLQSFCMVFVSHVDAETLGVSHLDPVTVRIAGLSLEGKSWLPPLPPYPCFILHVEDYIPKNCAYFYATAARRHLLPTGVPKDRKLLLLDGARVEIMPVTHVLPTACIQLKPNFNYAIGHARLTCQGYLLSRMTVSGDDSPTLANSFLVTAGSKVFVNDENSFTITSVQKTAASNVAGLGSYKAYTLHNGAYISSGPLLLDNETDAALKACKSDHEDDSARKIVTNRYYYAARGFTKLILLDSDDPSFDEKTKQKPLFYCDPPQLAVLMKRISSATTWIKKVGLDWTNCVLVHGPARVGKKALVEQAARRLKMSFIPHDPHDDLCDEADVVKLYERAQARAPCVVRLAMADIIFTEKLDGRPNHLVPALLNQLQLLKMRKCPVVTVLTCTRLKSVATALRAAAALHVLYLPLPTLEQREELVRRGLHCVFGYSAQVLPQATTKIGGQTDADNILGPDQTLHKSLSNQECDGTNNASLVDGTREAFDVPPERGVHEKNIMKISDAHLPSVEGVSADVEQGVRFSEEAARSARRCPDSDGRPKCSDESIMALAKATDGYTFTEILREIETQIFLQKRANPSTAPCDLSGKLVEVTTPLAYRLRNRSFVRKTTWDHIQGYTGLKQMLQRQVSLYREDPAHYPLRGLLLYGPPGCSKTMFVEALATETGFSFFPLMGSVVLSKFVGETEKNLRSLIQQARAAAPSIVFIDEVDGLCKKRDANGSGGHTPVAELLDLMGNCVEQTGYRNVLFVGATNRPEHVDEGLLQARFLSIVVHVGLPDCESRCAMWQYKLAPAPCKGVIDVRQLCRATEGFSGAEIVGVYQDAGHKKILDVQAAMPDASDDDIEDNLFFTQDILMDAISRNSSRTPQDLLLEIDRFSRARK